jgi:long-chain acyl-CoA synthetase
VQTIDSLLKESCQKHAARTALRHKVNNSWQEISYAELWNYSDRIAAGLMKGGFQPGQHAAILAPASPRWVFAYLGALKAGGVVIPVDKELKSAELRHILTDCEATVIFTDRPNLDTLLECIPALPLLERIVMLHPAPSRGGDSRTAKALETLLEEWQALVTTLNLPAERVARLETLASQVHRLMTAPAGAKSETSDSQDPFSPTRLSPPVLVNLTTSP